MGKYMNIKLEKIANKVIKKINVPAQDQYQSVILVVMVISVILSLIRVVQECDNKKLKLLSNKKDQAQFMQQSVKNICIKKNLLNQWRLKKIIKQKLSPEDYKNLGDQLKKAIMDVGVDLTDDESLTLMEAANNV
jgi:hypothetical protein